MINPELINVETILLKERYILFFSKAEARFLQAEAYPGDQVHMEISAAAGSLCAVGVVDRSVQAIQTASANYCHMR